ncbi:MAG: ATP-binding protein [Clostridium sp.]|nr:ATP-binding protein [Clostridium sp.]
MIVTPENMSFDSKKFSMILYGSPGVGKTTLALSAPDPILIDFDRGMSRVRTQHRKTSIFCDTYEDVLTDLESPAMKDFQTIVVDTGGSFITYLQDWAMRADPKVNKQKNGAISLKGFGAVKQEFSRFTGYVRDTLNKNLIYVFHSMEQTDKDGNVQVRLMCEGAAKNIVWTPCDFGGYVQMIGNQRVVCFTPEQEYFAKGCHGIKGQMVVPELGPNDENNFITKLFDKAKANIAAEAEAYAPIKAQYEAVMETVRKMLESVTDAESANKVSTDIQALAHASTSLKESSKMLKDKAASIGLVYSKSAAGFIKAPKEG